MKKLKDNHSPVPYSSPLFTTLLMASYFSLSHTHTHTHATVMWFVCCNNRFLMDTLTLKPLNPRLAQWPSKAPGLLASSVCQWFCHKCLFVSEWNVSTRLWELFWVELFFSQLRDYGRSCVSCPTGHEFLCCCVIWLVSWVCANFSLFLCL